MYIQERIKPMTLQKLDNVAVNLCLLPQTQIEATRAEILNKICISALDKIEMLHVINRKIAQRKERGLWTY